MKRFLSLFLIAAVFFTACGRQHSPAWGSAADANGFRLLVYTSVYPLYDFTQKIAGGLAEVMLLSPDGMEPHDWEPTPADIARLGEADILFYNGAGLEHWVESVTSSLKDSGLLAVNASAAVSLMEINHENERQGDHDHGGNDPHVWLSPANAKLQMESIREALCRLDPDNADTYRANCERWQSELDTLDSEYREALFSLPNKEIIVAHEAFGYLCRDYDLHQTGAMGFSPDSEPSLAQMAALSDFAREHHAKVIFFEDAASPKIAEAIARETGAETGILYPIETLTNAQKQAGEDYFSLMRHNLNSLQYALSD